jgi:hypothetical protein
MKDNPMGMVLLSLMQENIRLAEKSGKETTLNVPMMVHNFNQFLDMGNKDSDQEERMLRCVEDRIVNREINSYLLSSGGLELPSVFGTKDQLGDPAIRADALRMFPVRNKFSGTDSEGLLEFISNINMAQNHLQLSEKEFLQMLQLSTTGRAHSLITDQIQNGAGVAAIYHVLSLHYDMRMSATDAKQKLHVYKVSKTENLAKLISYVTYLSQRSVSDLPPGVGRQHVLDQTICQGIIRALPHASQSLAQNTYSNLSTRLGRQVTGFEFSKALNMYRASIDADIQREGLDKEKRKEDNKANKSGKKYWRQDRNQNQMAMINAISAGPTGSDLGAKPKKNQEGKSTER